MVDSLIPDAVLSGGCHGLKRGLHLFRRLSLLIAICLRFVFGFIEMDKYGDEAETKWSRRPFNPDLELMDGFFD